MPEQRTVLILCTGNSCRSQMAEALINDRLGNRWIAFSAGVDPADVVHPKAIEVLAEIGIRHEGAPKHVDAFQGRVFDQVITVCDEAAEACPVWLGGGVRTHIGFPDPAKAEGSPEEITRFFRKVRDDIEAKILGYLRETKTFTPSGR
jgi:arsenate reductase